MVRYPFIYNQVLQLYKRMGKIEFPIDPSSIVKTIPNCRILTYQRFAEMNDVSIDDVISLCESKSGCTHYDIASDRYLILWNADSSENNVDGRKRWTKAHELGHVILKHFPLSAEQRLSENGFNNLSVPEYEVEADRFAASFLSPMPLYDTLHIKSQAEIQSVFGLSREAANNRWKEYQRWLQYHRKTAWENDMRKLYSLQMRDSAPPESEESVEDDGDWQDFFLMM